MTALQRRKHEATVRRKNALLDLNAAAERLRNGKPEDMEKWMARYQWAVMTQRAVFGRRGM